MKRETRARERRAKRPMVTMTSLQETFCDAQNPKSKRQGRRRRPGRETKKRKTTEKTNTGTIEGDGERRW